MKLDKVIFFQFYLPNNYVMLVLPHFTFIDNGDQEKLSKVS